MHDSNPKEGALTDWSTFERVTGPVTGLLALQWHILMTSTLSLFHSFHVVVNAEGLDYLSFFFFFRLNLQSKKHHPILHLLNQFRLQMVKLLQKKKEKKRAFFLLGFLSIVETENRRARIPQKRLLLPYF